MFVCVCVCLYLCVLCLPVGMCVCVCVLGEKQLITNIVDNVDREFLKDRCRVCRFVTLGHI